MKYIKSITLGLSFLLILFGLLGCGSESSTKKTGEAGKIEVDNSVEGDKAKKELIDKISLISEQNKDATNKVGYLESEAFITLKGDFNLIAKATGSAAIIDMNDGEHIEENIELLTKDVNALSSGEALKASKLLNSGKTIYEAVLMEDLHQVMESIDVSSYDNDLSTFINLNQDITSIDEISNEANETEDYIKDYTYKELDRLGLLIKEHENQFSSTEIDSLNSVIQNLKSSIQMQVNILQEFKAFYIDDGLEIEDKLNSAQTDFDDAANELEVLESEMGVEYLEEE
ncbi:hypothetical protein [Bacillus sp. V59.32b]|uniref:hypothetical protein n=1 Tax=Bacillus sp. V59.32b TaxID=1758642 RepID=UPI000E3EC3A4|nr:hypothetical protein [Bacillus sp. V59.32b]RFU69389.1 hypothetical protein D0463_02485 [Bacillus sp. V59.32b]